MNQTSYDFEGAGFEQYWRPTKRDVFLATINQIVPWTQLCQIIEPYYPNSGNGRPPDVFAGVERLWGFMQMRYRGLTKNATRAFVALGLVNIYLTREHLLA